MERCRLARRTVWKKRYDLRLSDQCFGIPQRRTKSEVSFGLGFETARKDRYFRYSIIHFSEVVVCEITKVHTSDLCGEGIVQWDCRDVAIFFVWHCRAEDSDTDYGKSLSLTTTYSCYGTFSYRP